MSKQTTIVIVVCIIVMMTFVVLFLCLYWAKKADEERNFIEIEDEDVTLEDSLPQRINVAYLNEELSEGTNQ